MEKEEILSTISAIIENVLNATDLNLNYESTANDVDGWNSLTNMQIISEIEKHLGIKFKLRDIIKMKNVGDLCITVYNKQMAK
jgi:acyl carrier protein